MSDCILYDPIRVNNKITMDFFGYHGIPATETFIRKSYNYAKEHYNLPEINEEELNRLIIAKTRGGTYTPQEWREYFNNNKI